MKKVYFLITAALLLSGCSQPDSAQLDDTELQFTDQKWELVRMTGSIPNSETTGAGMEWQEYYVFGLDGTFEKIRSRAGITSKATGTFEVAEYNNDDADYLELSYQSGLELIATCYGDQKEVLIYRSSAEISNTWLACDGPGLDYKLVED